MMSFMPIRRLARPPSVGIALVAIALVVRLWGIRHGLPIAYNSDEDSHFVPGAVALFGHGWNPHYFANPPALTYAFRLLFAVLFGGGDRFAHDPGAYFLAGRVLVAVLGAVAVGLLYRAGTLLFDRETGLLAGGLVAVAFLPVFYSHLALNDVPAMTGVCLALLGTAKVLERGWALDYAVAGAGVGLAAATKYTAALALLPLAGAMLGSPHRVPRRLLLGVGFAALAFLVANPYALLDAGSFWSGIHDQAGLSTAGKLGQTQSSGILYYLGVSTWGLGWIPALAALAGGGLLLVRDRRRAIVLLPPLALFLLTLGLEGRYFSRWLLPVVPMIALVAAHAAREATRRGVPLALVAVLFLGQGAYATVRLDRILSRPDARNDARAWMVAHIPAGSRVVFEPTLRPRFSAGWVRYPPPRGKLLDEYELSLSPRLLAVYRRRRFCTVVTDSNEAGRALADPGRAAQALAYYRTLAREARLVHVSSPFAAGASPPRFDFDASYQFRNSAFRRPGSEIRVYALRHCGRSVSSKHAP
jgi:4-amino-4-deoxy-L-arabinose transferase-like glycosyltransferase